MSQAIAGKLLRPSLPFPWQERTHHDKKKEQRVRLAQDALFSDRDKPTTSFGLGYAAGLGKLIKALKVFPISCLKCFCRGSFSPSLLFLRSSARTPPDVTETPARNACIKPKAPLPTAQALLQPAALAIMCSLR